MTNYTFYRITHKDYPLLNYIGSTKNFNKRKQYHKIDCINEKSVHYNLKLYLFIRNNDINFNELEFSIISQFNLKSNQHSFKHERFWIEKYDSINNGLNERLPFTTTDEKKSK